MTQIRRRRIELLTGISFFLVLTVILLSSPGVLRTQEGQALKNPMPMTPESIKAGEEVFFTYCSGCHGRRADGRGRKSLNLIPRPQNLRNAQFVKYLSDERMYTSISGGVRGTSMPAFDMILTAGRRWNVINYIRSLTASDTLELANAIAYQPVAADAKNPVERTAASIRQGKELFLDYCANCHGAEADGQGVIAENLVPRPRNLVVITSWGGRPFMDFMDDARLYDSITNGVPGTSMLPWIGVFNEEQIWHLINYLRSEAAQMKERIGLSYGQRPK